MIAEDLSEVCRCHAARMAHEELDAELLLEAAQLLAEGRLRDMQMVGRLRQAAGFGNLQEIAKLPEIHRMTPFRCKLAILARRAR